MITVPYTKVLQLAVEMASRTYPPTTEQATIFKTFITHHLRSVWESYAWPEVCLPSQEFFAPVWREHGVYNFGDVVYYSPSRKYFQMVRAGTVIAITGNTPLELAYWGEANAVPAASLGEYRSDVTYAVGDRVTYNGNVYQFCVAAPAGTPPIDLEHWGLVLPFFRFISKTLQRDGTPRLDVIGEFFGITLEDPRAIMQTTPIPFATMFQGSVGAVVFDAFPSVWIYYRRTPPTTLADDALIPARFSEVIALRAASSMLRTDGKSDQANEFSALADFALQSELEKAVTHESQAFRTAVFAR